MKKPLILVIDDSLAERVLMRNILKNDYEIITEKTHSEGLIRLSIELNNIKLVILDYMLNDYDRSSTEIAGVVNKYNIPLIYYSGFGKVPDGINPDQWIKKENYTELTEKIKEVLKEND